MIGFIIKCKNYYNKDIFVLNPIAKKINEHFKMEKAIWIFMFFKNSIDFIFYSIKLFSWFKQTFIYYEHEYNSLKFMEKDRILKSYNIEIIRNIFLKVK